MGGAALSGDLRETVKEFSELRQKPADASDVNDLKKGKEEILKLRTLCRQQSENKFIRNLDDLGPFSEEIRKQIQNPQDVSDIDDLQKAKEEIIKLRSIWLSIKLSDADLSRLLSDDNEQKMTNEEFNSKNPIISTIQQKITNEVALTYFQQHDLNGSGLIERNELRRFIRMQGVVYTESDLESLMDRYDINDDGKLAYGEFLKAFSRDSATLVSNADSLTTSVKMKLNTPGPLQSFQLSDRDSSGTVDRAEMRRLLRVHGIPYREEDFDSFFTLHDLSGDGKLNFEEFCQAMGCSERKVE